jgi:hypothetical protein
VILTGARDGALPSFRLKHIDISAQTLFQDAREVRTKGRKTFTSIFFPVGPEPREIVSDYVAMLKVDLSFSEDDPLFPSTQIGRGEDRGFCCRRVVPHPVERRRTNSKDFPGRFRSCWVSLRKPAQLS